MKYKHAISLGNFCGVAQELERYGFRNYSMPFDWVISDTSTINQLIENDYKNLFDINCLYRDANHPYIVKHKLYKFDFYHDFDRALPIEQQLSTVASKYQRRIKRFAELLSSHEPILFIVYVIGESSVTASGEDVSESVDRFIDIIKNKTSSEFKVLLVKNNGRTFGKFRNDEYIDEFSVEKSDDFVNPRFMSANRRQIKKYIKKNVEGSYRMRNILRFNAKQGQHIVLTALTKLKIIKISKRITKG